MTVWGNEKHWERKYWRKIFEDCTELYLQHSGLRQNGLQYETNLQTRLPDWKTKFVKVNRTEHFKIHALYPK